MSKKYQSFAKVVELEDGKLLLISVMNKEQLEAVYSVIEPVSRSWRGQYQALAKAIVKAINDWKGN